MLPLALSLQKLSLTSLTVYALCFSSSALATDPEIMLHENDVADKGHVTAALHANQTTLGRKVSGDDTWPAHQQTNLMAEFATGLAPGWEIGVHLPIRRTGIDSPSGHEGAWSSSGATQVLI